MTNYYYIPKVYEAMLLTAINNWIDNPNAYVVVTGVYQKTIVQNIGLELDTTVKDMTGKFIKRLYYYTEFGDKIKNDILGFCLKGELPQDLHQLAISLDGVKCFDSPESYLEFIDELI